MIKIINLATTKTDKYIYIGRYNKSINANKSLLANPYKINSLNSRESVLQKYKEWLFKNIEMKTQVYDYLCYLQKLSKTQDIVLGCWCKPLDCHGDIIKEIIENETL